VFRYYYIECVQKCKALFLSTVYHRCFYRPFTTALRPFGSAPVAAGRRYTQPADWQASRRASVVLDTDGKYGLRKSFSQVFKK
jgi:hypothetical protein